MAVQHVELIDEVMYDFPELVFVTRHGCEPWTELAVKLMLKWPNLHYSTSAFAPKYYPQDVIDYANTRGADRIIYAGYFPMGLSLLDLTDAGSNVPFTMSHVAVGLIIYWTWSNVLTILQQYVIMRRFKVENPIDTALASHLTFMIFGALIVFFLIVEPHGLARLWSIAKEKLRLWPFPH